MKITAQEEYGLRCMMLLAKSSLDKPLTIPEISRMEGLSIPYTGKLLMILKQAGLIGAVRGRNGGYILSQSPEKISLNIIFSALGDPLYGPRHCLRHTGSNETCVHLNDCTVKPMWQSFDRFVSGFLKKVTLSDLTSGNFELPNFANSEKPDVEITSANNDSG